MHDGKTVGRHYAGPMWTVGLSEIKAKVSGTTYAPNPMDIAWLNVEDPADEGALDGATTVQRINTVRGMLAGDCAKSGDLRAEPYEADYLFLKK